MSQFNHQGQILPETSNISDNGDEPGIAQPVSEAEIDELLYGEDRPVEERVARLREFRDDLLEREPADFGDGDPQALIAEINRAIAKLEQASDDGEGMPASFDPLEHRETMSPDDDALVALEDADEEDFEEEDVLDPEEWDEGDDFRPERGVH
ncbi:MAG TPA: hypothetical protein VGM83_01620 [Devosiaceae bacterium]|jgi:hypothetical protein